MIWPEHVKQRIRDTYMYFGASLGVTAGTAVAIFRSPAMMNIVARQGMVAMGVSIAAMIGSGMLVRSIPYQEGFGNKQMAWLLHSAVVGAVVAPIMLLGGPILTRAAWYTAGVVGGLTTVAVTAPSEIPVYGWSIGHGFWSSLYGFNWISILATNYCTWSWNGLNLAIRRPGSVFWIYALQHSKDHSRG